MKRLLSSDNQGESEGSPRYECQDDGGCGEVGQGGAGWWGERGRRACVGLQKVLIPKMMTPVPSQSVWEGFWIST